MKDSQLSKNTIGNKNNTYLVRYHVFAIPFLLLCILGILIVWSESIQIFISRYQLVSSPVILDQPALYPVLKKSLPVVSAQAVAILDDSSHVLLYGNHENLRLSPASTTKIMTALVALSYFKPYDTITVKSVIDTQGSGLGLVKGQQMTFEQMLSGALIYSANDAAYTIAENYPGGVKEFVNAMNQKAKELKLYNTHFGDPAGLADDDDYTTAKDLVKLTAVAMKNPVFANIVATKYTTLMTLDKKQFFAITNRNKLLGMLGINGVKTGFTDQAGEVLATSLDIQGHRIYIVVMKSDDRFADTTLLVTSLTEGLHYQSIRPTLR